MKPYNILIVEDHPFQRMYLQHLLSELGEFNLECARDGNEALQRLHDRCRQHLSDRHRPHPARAFA